MSPEASPRGGLILALNAGSSTLKASVLDPATLPAGRSLATWASEPPEPVASCSIPLGDDASRGRATDGALRAVLDRLSGAGVAPGQIAAVAHRVVHGGTHHRRPAVIDAAVLGAIDAAAGLAPLHNAVGAAVIRSARDGLPAIPHVAVFDTAFHDQLPEAEWRYPLPGAWEPWEIRRFGFHGLSVEWATARSGALLARRPEELRLIIAHLGNGCSVSAVAGGRSVATSMGMTPLEGLMMGTRAGSIDPGILLAVLRDGRRSVEALAEDLDHASGLLGVSGLSADMRVLEQAAEDGDRRAALAIEMFVTHAAAAIAAAASRLERLDAIVFTGGIGAHSPAIRARVAGRLPVLGVPPIPPAEVAADDNLAPGRQPAVLRVVAREDLVAARATMDLLG